MTATEAIASSPPADAEFSWAVANETCLEGELRSLRLRLKRRILWLRRQWTQDPLQNYPALVISDVQADRLLAGEQPHGEARFYQENQEAAAISRSLVEAEHALAVHRQVLLDAGTPPALEVLGHLFGLAPFDRRVLVLCLAPEFEPSFERLYAYVQDDVKRPYATLHLALALFAQGPDTGPAFGDARNRFLPEAPLRRYRLVTVEPGPLPSTPVGARPLRLDERIVAYLRGINRLDERVAALLRPVSAGLLTPFHRDLADRLTAACEIGGRRARWPVLNLIGPPDAGKRAVAQCLCERMRWQLHALDVQRLPAVGSERNDALRLLEREAVLLQSAFYLDATDADSADPVLRASLDGVIEDLNAFLIVASRERWHSEREMLSVPVPRPDSGQQVALWRQALAGSGDGFDRHGEALVQQFDFGPEAIARTVAAAAQARLRNPEEDAGMTAADLWQAAREHSGWHMGSLAQQITPCYTWQDLVLPDDIVRQLQELAAQVACRPQVYEAWGFAAKLGRGRGISALFAGPSGTGKTMAAEVLANHLQLDLYRIDLAGVVSKYIGETEKNLKKVFDAAEQSGAILFFDEADALFGKRTEVKDSHDRYANIEVDYLLQRMEDYRGLAILATNRKSALDSAFLRRLRFLVDFPFPRAESRRQIWQRVFPSQAPLNGVNFDHLARLDITGGNIRNIALNAAFLAAQNNEHIGMTHVMHAVQREYVKVDKLITQAEFGPYYDWVRS